MNAWSEWVRTITGDASARAIGLRVGKSHVTAQAWKEHPPGPEGVQLLARAYAASVVEGFKAAGWLSDTDLARARVPVLAGFSDQQLLAELQRRAKVRSVQEQGWTITG